MCSSFYANGFLYSTRGRGNIYAVGSSSSPGRRFCSKSAKSMAESKVVAERLSPSVASVTSGLKRMSQTVEFLSENYKGFGALAMLVGGSFATFWYGTQIHDWYFPTTEADLRKELENQAVAKLSSKWVVPTAQLPEQPINREDVLRKLQAINDAPKPGGYLVLVGKKGSGKSTLVRQAFKDKEGIAYLHIPSKVLSEEVWPSKFFDMVGIPRELVKGDPEVYFEKLFCSVAQNLKYKDSEGKEQPGRVPLLVVEIESRTQDDDLVRTVFSAVKVLVADKAAIKAVVVLSDALAGKDLTPDPRRKYLWVGDLTQEEAKEYLKKNGFAEKLKAQNPALSEKELDQHVTDMEGKLLSEVGTHVYDLYTVTHDAIAVEDFIKQKLADARGRVSGTIDWAEQQSPPVPIHAIFQLLLNDPAGVPIDQLKEETGVGAARLFPVLKACHALVFNPETQCFSFSSTSVQTTAKAWLEKKRQAK